MKNAINSILKEIKCKYHIEKEFLQYYSVDASSYQIKPEIIIFPKTIHDVQQIIRLAKEFSISVTARGAGTGLVGSTLNNGIILDMKNFNHLKILDSSVTVGPAVTKGFLDAKLKGKSKFFAPNPSIGPFCSIGGMIANNSSGSHTLKYGSVIDNLEEVTFVDGNANLITLPKNIKYAKKIVEIANKACRQKFPCVSKNSCGYRLDAINNIADTPKIIAASEGTLGIIVSAKLKILKIPTRTILAIVEYDSEQKAAKDCTKIIRTKPSAIEFVDKKTMDKINQNFSMASKCLLFVEYDTHLNRSISVLKKICSGKIKILRKEKDIQKWWRFRDSALSYSLQSIPKNKRIPHIIEDATVPIEELDKLFLIIQKLNRMYRTDSVFYGHAGNGNIHVRLISKRKDLKTLKKIADAYFSQIFRLGGSITGEHGDGLARTDYVEAQYGRQNYQAFKELKTFFDPHNVLNPGKIIRKEETMLKNLEQF